MSDEEAFEAVDEIDRTRRSKYDSMLSDFMSRNIKRALINTTFTKVRFNHLAVILRNRVRLRELPIAVPTSRERVFLERTDLPENP